MTTKPNIKRIKAWVVIAPKWTGNSILFRGYLHEEQARIFPSKAAVKRSGYREDDCFKIVPCEIVYKLPKTKR